MSRPFAAMRACLLAAGGLVALSLLAACGQLPSPRIMDDAPGLGRVAELLKAPPLRDVPGSLGELRPPYPCGDSLYLTMQFASRAGVVYIAGADRYAVLDIGTGDTVVTGVGKPGGRISPNGRVLMLPVDEGLELRNTETGEVLAFLPGATGDEFDWVGDSGTVHIAPATPFRRPRLVYLDLATGLESSLAFVDPRPSRYIFDFGLVVSPEQGPGYLLARQRIHALMLQPGAGGMVAELGDSRPADFIRAPDPSLLVGNHFVVFEDEAATYRPFAASDIPSEDARVELPGFFPAYGLQTADPDRLLIRGYFKDEVGSVIRRDGDAVWRDFYYSVSRMSLAPVELAVDVSKLHFVQSVRRHVLATERSFVPYAMPDGGAEGEPAAVLAVARAEVLASVDESP